MNFRTAKWSSAASLGGIGISFVAQNNHAVVATAPPWGVPWPAKKPRVPQSWSAGSGWRSSTV
eukprot:15431550-Alexandrium_andersonii.AAC.1